jgi:hypothetical protein
MSWNCLTLAHYVGCVDKLTIMGRELDHSIMRNQQPLAPSKVSIMRAAEKSHIFPSCDVLLLPRAEQTTKLRFAVHLLYAILACPFSCGMEFEERFVIDPKHTNCITQTWFDFVAFFLITFWTVYRHPEESTKKF